MYKKAEIVISIIKRLRERKALDFEELKDMVEDQELFELLTSEGFVDPARHRINFNLETRLQLSLVALKYGADIEKVCKLLSWKEFEAFSRRVLETNNFFCIQNFRFSQNQRRYEIDVVRLKNPLVLCVDSKHYKKSGKNQILKTYCKKQIERAEALSKALPKMFLKMGLLGWKEAKIIPLIVTLLAEGVNFSEGVPIVPFFKLNSFVMDLPNHLNQVYQIYTKIPIIKPLGKQNQ
ncbi:MAG: hypothetical protein KIH08_06510 [Candidatus Freyarchaeota archaeon]|nr:hypothetical protein [Candidatus Jordarchaeia archaeon]MBS7267533.1 hypothetical protein [Candidatus Jordarchaeia archaeon]MBS7278391.1 hypothetical protein [Candidatus Jordarchaeia archaeon]